MLENRFVPIRMRVLVVDDQLVEESALGRSARALVRDIEAHNMEVVQAISADDGMAVFMSDAAIHAVMLDWTLGDDDAKTHEKAVALLRYIRSRNDRAPVFLMAERGEATSLPIDVMQMADEYVWTLEDTGAFVSGRVEAAARRYLEEVLPPMAKALGQFARTHEYSWHTPGHSGGDSLRGSPWVGDFYDFVGEDMLRADLSVSVSRVM